MDGVINAQINGKTRFGLIHGIGLGYVAELKDKGERDKELYLNFHAGVLLETQVTDFHTFYVGARAGITKVNDFEDTEQFDTKYGATTNVTLGAGLQINLGSIQITPEINYTRNWMDVTTYDWNDNEEKEELKLWYLKPTITASVPF